MQSRTPHPLAEGRWLNRPDDVVIDADRVSFATSPQTDLWQRTYYGFRRGNAPAYVVDTHHNVTFTVRATYRYVERYDQAGVLVWIDDENWVKASVEHEDDSFARLGTVVTNAGYSDWSTTDVAPGTTARLRVSRRGPDLMVEAALPDSGWHQLRICHLAALGHTSTGMAEQPAADLPAKSVAVGVYACSPQQSSFVATFDQIRLEPSRWQPHR